MSTFFSPETPVKGLEVLTEMQKLTLNSKNISFKAVQATGILHSLVRSRTEQNLEWIAHMTVLYIHRLAQLAFSPLDQNENRWLKSLVHCWSVKVKENRVCTCVHPSSVLNLSLLYIPTKVSKKRKTICKEFPPSRQQAELPFKSTNETIPTP